MENTATVKRRGRPPKLAPEERQSTIDAVLTAIADGQTLTEIEKLPGMPKRQTLNTWIATNAHGAADKYKAAREVRADRIADEIFAIADNADTSNPAAVQKARLQCDARRWYLSKIMPEKYGEQTAKVEVTASRNTAIVGADAIAEVMRLRAMIRQAEADTEDPDSAPDNNA